jgi:single-strand DNA-binding protein
VLNVAVLIGRLTADPEARHTGSGHAVASFTLAVDRPFRNQQGEQEADFIDVVCWRALAETVAAEVGKGALVAVQGRVQVRRYETEDGQRRKAAEVVADTVRFLEPKAVRAARAGDGAAAARDTGSDGDDAV